MASTPAFDSERETVVLAGFGQMAANILLQLKQRWPKLKVVVLARKRIDQELAMAFGADLAIPLAVANWDANENLEPIMLAAEAQEASLAIVQAQIRAFRQAQAKNTSVHRENVRVFQEARKFAGDSIASVLECTGQHHLFRAALDARTVRGDGTYGAVSCLYDVTFDVAAMRRDGASLWNLRRSRDQFPHVLQALARNPSYYEKLIGPVVEFANVTDLYTGKVLRQGGPKIMIQY
jgi:threonine dehydrogenase-like Zn-dependent dehydrogenase